METTLQHPASTAPPAPLPKKIFRLAFHGTGGALFGIFIMNVLKTILSLGIYYFWGKVKTRQFVWGQTEFAGDRFGYHGTGKELMFGWVKAAVLFAGIVALQNALGLGGHPFLGVLLLWTGIAFLVPVAQIGTLRYRLSRSSWRGIRFSFRGETKPFLLLSLKMLALTALTLGFGYAYYECATRAYLINHCRFGKAAFAFNGQPRQLFWMYVKHGIVLTVGVVVLLIFTFAGRDLSTSNGLFGAASLGVAMFIPFVLLYGLVLLSIAVRRRRFYWDHTTFAGAQFTTTVTMANLLGLYLTNGLLLLCSLGLAFPWVTVRSRLYDCAHLTLTGALDLDAIEQDAQTAAAVGEELSGFLDVDAMAG
ncbi:YjgN family protein [Nitrospira moscoviensis]|uniref:DUF898 domain-containing protein n=1 Tax=Nitrospira moscoviensis TaxID=42253 RepID=A0A0K2GHQ4_NITMO|nr:DUF898 family protein [Nitrospira moscoviensis]ALA60394.1 conserved membrane protein of unknown function [Nitrospira moscoviensis]